MLELAVLGLLKEQPLHGYELKKRLGETLGFLWGVSYVYGDRLRHANGRCISTDGELERLVASHDEFSRYVVEVCLDCRWNHLQRHELHGRRYAS